MNQNNLTADKPAAPGAPAKKRGMKIGLIPQVAIFFLIGVLMTGAMTYICETYLYDGSVKNQVEQQADEIAGEAIRSVREFPAHDWLVRYWYTHADGMDIEYDADFDGENETAGKCRVFSERHPDLQIRYLNADQCESLPPEDQKLYAEITYSWLITRINQIKQTHHVSFLFCVITEEPFDKQFFLFSGADPGAVRGTNYEEVYTVGHVVSVAESQTEAMREATRNLSHLANAGNYVDYYAHLSSLDEHEILIGLTYDLSALRANIDAQTRTGATLAILHQIFLSLICLLLIWLFVLRPLKKVQRSIRIFKETKSSEVIARDLEQIRTHNEIGQLSADTLDMIREIESHVEKIQAITAEKQRISTELSLATRIQAAMLPGVFPPFPDRKEFDLYASMDPAKEVGGDFYDFFLIDDDHLALVIADVSGKGVPAALFMMISKILVKMHTNSGLSPVQVLETVNRQICANNPEEMFVTVWLGILEISTGKLTTSNAGHEFPALKKPGGKFELVKDPHGLVVGGMDGIRYKEYHLDLEPGSKLFVYTDGLPEATDAKEEMFGAERMLDALNGAGDASPREILHTVREAVNGFVKDAEQFDDLTMLCLDFFGQQDQTEDTDASEK